MTEPDLATWLLEQIADDDSKVRGPGRPSILGLPRKWIGRVWFPGRIRDECTAKRRIVELHGHTTEAVWQDHSKDWEVCNECGAGPGNHGCVPWPCETLKILALPYFDRDGYRDEWRPWTRRS